MAKGFVGKELSLLPRVDFLILKCCMSEGPSTSKNY